MCLHVARHGLYKLVKGCLSVLCASVDGAIRCGSWTRMDHFHYRPDQHHHRQQQQQQEEQQELEEWHQQLDLEHHIRHCQCSCNHMGYGNYWSYKVPAPLTDIFLFFKDSSGFFSFSC